MHHAICQRQLSFLLHCALAAAQCIVVGVFVGLLPRQLEMAYIDLHQTGSISEGSDHLQLIKFWPFRAPGKGSAVGRNFLAPLYYSQCLRLCERFSL